jgi:hypothetical protein
MIIQSTGQAASYLVATEGQEAGFITSLAPEKGSNILLDNIFLFAINVHRQEAACRWQTAFVLRQPNSLVNIIEITRVKFQVCAQKEFRHLQDLILLLCGQ